MDPLITDAQDGLEIEPGRRKSDDSDLPESPEDSSEVEQDEMKKVEIREEISKIEKEIDSINNTINYGDDERLSFLETKLDALKVKLLRDEM